MSLFVLLWFGVSGSTSEFLLSSSVVEVSSSSLSSVRLITLFSFHCITHV